MQIAPELHPNDNRVKNINVRYDKLEDNPFIGAFYDRYAKAFHLTA